MNSQISQISGIMEDIKEKISDNEYKKVMDNLMKIHNNDDNNNNTIETIRERLHSQAHARELKTTERRRRSEPTTGRRMTEEQINHFKKVSLSVAELKQRTNRIINQ